MAAPAAVAASSAFASSLWAALKTAGLSAASAGAIVSPLSAWFALVLVLNGAGPGSQTQRELWSALGGSGAATADGLAALNNGSAALLRQLNSQASGATQLVVANALWTKKGLALRPGFTAQMQALFQAPVQAVSSAAPINAWATQVTRGLITQAVPPDVAFDLVVTNAVYFKGAWEYGFDRSLTSKRAFSVPAADGGSSKVQVDMMSRAFKPRELQGSQPVRYAEIGHSFRGVRLPYKGSPGLAAVAVLPAPKAFASAEAAASAFGAAQLFDRAAWRGLFETGTLQVSLPRFKVAVSQLALKPALQSMGVRAAFDPKLADFSRISESPLFVTSVLQSAVVQVDEMGTEAAAVTAVVAVMTSAILQPTPPLVFDRPFLFYIVDDVSKVVLFQGVVKDPSRAIAG